MLISLFLKPWSSFFLKPTCHETMVHESCRRRRQYLAQCLSFPCVASDGLYTSRDIFLLKTMIVKLVWHRSEQHIQRRQLTRSPEQKKNVVIRLDVNNQRNRSRRIHVKLKDTLLTNVLPNHGKQQVCICDPCFP
jgi:hypothetical protein